MAAFSEQQVRNRLIEQFIQQDPLTIALRRPVFTTTAAGGRKRTGEVLLEPQTFYFQPFRRRITQEYKYNPQSYGEEEGIFIHFLMIGGPDVQWQLKDEFNIEPDDEGASRLDVGLYIVEWINPSHWDHRQAGVVWRGLQDAG